MALLAIRPNLMINADKVEIVEFIDGELWITVGSRRFLIESKQEEVMKEIQRTNSFPDLMIKNNQLFGG